MYRIMVHQLHREPQRHSINITGFVKQVNFEMPLAGMNII